MRKFLLLLALSFSTQVFSQNIENPSFDSVYIGGIDRIFEWITSDSWQVPTNDTVFPLAPNTHYISTGLQYHELLNSVQLEYGSAFDGPLSIKVFTDTGRVDINGNPFRGFIVNGNHFYTDSTGYLDFARCGTPFPYRPVKLRGHYKYADSALTIGNNPQVYVLLKKYNFTLQQSETIGFAFASNQFSPASAWTAFDMPVNYASSQIPDSVVVAFYSPPLGHLSTFWIDSLGFYYGPSSDIADKTPLNTRDVYYNSNQKRLIIENPYEVNIIRIFDIQGRLVLEMREPGTSINLELKSYQIYFIGLNMKNGTLQNHKIIVGQ